MVGLGKEEDYKKKYGGASARPRPKPKKTKPKKAKKKRKMWMDYATPASHRAIAKLPAETQARLKKSTLEEGTNLLKSHRKWHGPGSAIRKPRKRR